MSTVKESTFLSTDGQHNCHYIVVTPDREPKGVVQISHGMCEYIERYLPFAEFLADNGFVVCGNDHLGHGKTANSTAELGKFPEEKGWQHAVSDLHRLTRIMKKEYLNLPYFLIGHSMGSFFARAYAVKYSYDCDAYIFMGTADCFETAAEDTVSKSELVSNVVDSISHIKPDINGRLGKVAIELMISYGETLRKLKGDGYRSKMLHKIGFGRNNERIENPKTSYDWISRDEDVVDNFVNDEYCNYIYTVNGLVNLASALWFVSNDKWYQNMPKDIPLLLLSGTEDPIGNYGRGVGNVYNKLCDYCCDASMILYEGARHEILNETDKEKTYNDILNFLLDNIDIYEL